MSGYPEVDFQTVPDPADVDLDDLWVTILTFEQGRAGGPGWVLYLDDGSGVESHYLGGDADDVDEAEEAAAAWLTTRGDDPNDD